MNDSVVGPVVVMVPVTVTSPEAPANWPVPPVNHEADRSCRFSLPIASSVTGTGTKQLPVGKRLRKRPT